MQLKDLIETTLRKACPSQEMEALLKFMEGNGYYTTFSSSHNHWPGGAAEHMWTCYVIAKEKRSEILKNKPHLLKYATDEKLAIVCLLHDLCDMKGITVKVGNQKDGKDVSHRHGKKSYWILRNHHVGTAAEQMAVQNHMHSDARSGLKDRRANEEYEALHDIISSVDRMASGVAWNSDRFLAGRSQHKGVLSKPGYLRAVALDRTKQCLDNHVLLGSDLCAHVVRGYNRDKIVWNTREDMVGKIKAADKEKDSISEDDIITLLHDKIQDKKNYCLVVGIDPNIPEDANKRLRGRWRHEQDLLICSNLLNALYRSDKKVVTTKRFHYGFSMREEIKDRYREQSKQKGIFLSGVYFFRDGASKGFRMVKPWKCDVLLVPGYKGARIIENE